MIALAAVLAASMASAPPEPLTAIVGATLVDGGGRPDLRDSVVVLRGATIAAAGDRMRTPIPKGAEIVDGRKAWLAPGPVAPVPAPSLAAAAASLARGREALVQPGRPARLLLLDADPRARAERVRVVRAWTVP